jgi:hypothetical protein
MKRVLSFITAGLTLLVTSAAYADSFDLRHGPRTPAAAGKVDFDKGDKGNNKVSVKAQYLAIPRDVDPKANTYVVWIDPGQGRGPMPVGTIAPDKNREGKLDMSTPYSEFDVLITAESSPTPAQPSSVVILRGHVGKPPLQNPQSGATPRQ